MSRCKSAPLCEAIPGSKFFLVDPLHSQQPYFREKIHHRKFAAITCSLFLSLRAYLLDPNVTCVRKIGKNYGLLVPVVYDKKGKTVIW